MAAWTIKGGRSGEYEDAFLEKGVVSLGFGLQQSVAGFADRNALRRACGKSREGADQMWRFYSEVGDGDMMVLPRKRASEVAVGRVNGCYVYQPDLVSSEVPHVRRVDWHVTDIPRSHFDRDLLNSFSAQLTLSKPRAQDAEARIERIAKAYLEAEEPEPVEISANGDSATGGGSGDEANGEIDIDREIRDRIVARLRRKFAGEQLEHLVASILEVSGYYVLKTQKGADGGVDVVAGKGDMGFGEPRLCVQVKGRTSPVDLAEYDRLRGNITGFGARHGLLVSLGGFTKPVRDRNAESFFEIRLWGPDELVQRLLETYEALPRDIQADVPLRDRKILDERDG